MARSKITVEELEDLWLSFDISVSVTLRASCPEEHADDPPEGFVAIYESAMQQGLHLPIHHFFREVMRDWNLAPCQITSNGWGQMLASYLLWVIVEVERNLSLKEFESIYRPYRSAGWYNVSPRPGCGKPPIPKRDQGELRSKWDKVRALSSDFRTLSNLLKDDNLLARYELMVQRSSCASSRLPHQWGRVLQHKLPDMRRRAHHKRSRTPRCQVPSPRHIPRPRLPFTSVRLHPPTSNLHIDSTPLRDKGKKVTDSAKEVPAQKRKAPATAEGLMRDAHKARRTEEGHRSSPSLDVETDGTGNSASSAGQSAFKSFDAEEAKSKKLAEDLKAMGLEKTQLESDKRALQFKLDLARGQRRATEASQKCAEEAQKSAEDRTLVAKNALAAANSSLEATVADNEKSLAAAKLELEKVRAERADAEAKAVEAYQDTFMDTPEYQDLAWCLMTVGGEQLVEWIMEAHPEWDISFLCKAPADAHTSEAVPIDNRGRDEGLSCADP
ncbi:Plus3 domain-containing protein [Abeliophyllum distichum]|uniref:Plus3 domain-containing protein n=1 Tax=Abeliophyllum distichum TaxID=126358 RepID=A0ABD1Q4T8_9LAMI